MSHNILHLPIYGTPTIKIFFLQKKELLHNQSSFPIVTKITKIEQGLQLLSLLAAKAVAPVPVLEDAKRRRKGIILTNGGPVYAGGKEGMAR